MKKINTKRFAKYFSILLCLGLWAHNSQAQDSLDNEYQSFLARETHQIKILNNGLASLYERIQLIENAKESIDLEYFIFNDDSSGNLILKKLIEKSLAGVKVRLLLDGFLPKGTIDQYRLAILKDSGVEIKFYNPVLLFKGTNNIFRNHRKFMIIDQKSVLTGGRNIGDEYFDLSESFNFLDREIVFSGDLSYEVLKSFNEIWKSKHANGKNIYNSEELYKKIVNENDILDYYIDLKNTKDKILNADTQISNELYTIGKSQWEKSFHTTCDNFQMITEKSLSRKKDTRNTARAINKYLNEKITNAEKSILIETPYFTFDDSNQKALNLALENNVKVDLVTNGANNTDVKISVALVDKLIRDWFKKGIKFHLFNGELPLGYPGTKAQNEIASFNALHAKTFVFDQQDIIIGTYNFDFYSAKFNNEVIFECKNAPRDFVLHVVDDIQKRQDRSTTVNSEKEIELFTDSTLLYNTIKTLAESIYKKVVN